MFERIAPHESREILLVEDNPDDARLIGTLLEGCRNPHDQLVPVDTLAAGAAQLRAGGIDAVLLDLKLPDGSGVECVSAIRSAASEVPIVVLTGTDDERLALSCLAAGAQDYLSKQEMQTQNLQRALRYAVARTREASARKRADVLQARLAAIVEASSDAILSTTLEGIITSWNSGAERIFGYTAEESLGRPVGELLHPVEDASPVDLGRLATRAVMGGPGREEVMTLTRDGVPVTLSVVACHLRDAGGRPAEVAAIVRDVSETKRRNAELRRNNDELKKRDRQMRALAARLHSIRDEERTRISRTVHDELGQLLSGLKMDLRWISRRLERSVDPSAAIEAKLVDANGLIDLTIQTTQRIALELRSNALDAFGLRGAMRDEARRFEARTGTATEVIVRCDAEPGREVSTTLFRIFQELLTNIGRHARASRVLIVLEDDAGRWSLSVEDNGIGFVPEESERDSSLGILGMRERAESLGGNLHIDSELGHGTVAVVRLPRTRGE